MTADQSIQASKKQNDFCLEHRFHLSELNRGSQKLLARIVRSILFLPLSISRYLLAGFAAPFAKVFIFSALSSFIQVSNALAQVDALPVLPPPSADAAPHSPYSVPPLTRSHQRRNMNAATPVLRTREIKRAPAVLPTTQVLVPPQIPAAPPGTAAAPSVQPPAPSQVRAAAAPTVAAPALGQAPAPGSPTAPAPALVPNVATSEVSKTEVLMFGGYGSTNTQMKAWEKSASNDAHHSGEFEFKGIALPSRHFSQAEVKRDAEATIRLWVEKIQKSPPGKKFVLTGHSSGSAVANEIIRRLQLQKPTRDLSTLKLIILDGFAPTGILDGVDVQCWSAIDAEHPEKGTWNQRAMKSCNTAHHQYHENKVTGCHFVMCLHYSSVNLNANTSSINSSNYRVTGYKAVRANLNWLENIAPQNQTPAAVPATGAPAIR